MNPFIKLKTTPPLLITLALLCFGPVPRAQAVVPPPPGGYPNFTTAAGDHALQALTLGVGNTAIGNFSLFSVTTGSFNTAAGAGALLFSTSDQNTAFGAAALLFNTLGFGNTAVGAAALLSNTGATLDTPNGGPGSANTAVGVSALSSNTTGGFNTAVGAYALANSLGFGNIALGSGAGSAVTTASNVICIGTSGANVDERCFIGHIYSNVQPTVGTDPDSVTINSDGRLGRGNVSSRRYKHDIKPMDTASETLYALKPVSFRYNKEYDGTQTLAFGLIAEEVAEVYPDLVGRNPKGEPESVRYEQVNAMLLNEFLKEHQKNEEQGATISKLKATAAEQEARATKQAATIAKQQKQIEALTAGLQKVSAQLELSKPAPRTVKNSE